MNDEEIEITRRPTTVAAACAIVAALAAVVAVGYVSPVVILLGGVGLVVLGAGLVRGVDGAVDLGCVGLFLGVVVAGLQGGSVEATLVGTAGTVVAWDLAGSAIALGDQLGREASTVRLEAVHAASSLLVGLTTVGIAYAIYAFAAGGQPVGALVLSIAAALLVTVGLGSRRGRPDRSSRRS